MAKQTDEQKLAAAEKKAAKAKKEEENKEPGVQPDPPLTSQSGEVEVQQNQDETAGQGNETIEDPLFVPNPVKNISDEEKKSLLEEANKKEIASAPKESKNSVAIILENAVTPQVIEDEEFVIGLDRRLKVGNQIKSDDDSHVFDVIYIGAGRFKEDDPGTAVFDHMLKQHAFKKAIKKDKVLSPGTKFRVM